jgi:hypothetical protein
MKIKNLDSDHILEIPDDLVKDIRDSLSRYPHTIECWNNFNHDATVIYDGTIVEFPKDSDPKLIDGSKSYKTVDGLDVKIYDIFDGDSELSSYIHGLIISNHGRGLAEWDRYGKFRDGLNYNRTTYSKHRHDLIEK